MTSGVGAVSSACLADLGHEVIGVDVAAEKVAMLARGQSPIVEDEIDELIAAGVKSGRLGATTDVADAVARTDVSFISVGTPSAPNGSVSMKAVDEVVLTIGRLAADSEQTVTIPVSVSAESRGLITGFAVVTSSTALPVFTNRAATVVIR